MDAEDRFTDSENEEGKKVEVAQVESPKGTSTKKKQLVSYCDDTYEDTSSEKEEDRSIESQLEDAEDPGGTCMLDNDVFPEPKGTCDPQLQDKIMKMMSKMKETDCDWNSIIQNKKSFRNPSIYEKLIEFCGINEFGTNYQPDVYDPNKWGKGSFYDDLYEVQKVEMEKRMEREKVKVVVGVAKAAKSSPPVADQELKKPAEVAETKDAKVGTKRKRKRNTKWDPGPNTVAILPRLVKPNFSGVFQRLVFIKKP